MPHFVGTMIALFVIALLSQLVRRDPNKWYGSMLCMRCAYRWVSRKSTPPARCPRCGGQNLHAATINQPVPERRAVVLPDFGQFEAPQTRRQKTVSVAVEARPILENKTKEQHVENHRRLERILRFGGATVEEKAYFLVALTRNPDPTNLMHRLKVDQVRAEELLQHLEKAGYVSAPDEVGERLVLAPEPRIDLSF